MTKFLKKIGIAFVCFLIITSIYTATILMYCAPQYSNNYQASIIHKIERLMDLEEPKIILVGNSNLAMGIDSELIMNQLDMPVVNLGLHGGLGNEFHENMAKFNISQDDIIVVCHSEYNNETIDSNLAWITIENHVQLYSLITRANVKEMASALPEYLLNCLIYKIRGTGNQAGYELYAKDAFNAYGDNIYPRNENNYVFSGEDRDELMIDEKCIKRLNELNVYCESQGAKLVLAGYPIANGEFTAEPKEYEEFQKRLEESLEAKIISDFTDYFIDYKYFYDTKLHLTDDGVQIRTKQLIEDLKNYQEEKALNEM